MSNMSSIFAQLRESRVEAINESVTDENTNVDSTVDNPATETEENQNEGANENSVDEVSATFCSECGALVSGYMNESQVEECPCCGSEELVEKVVKVVRDGKIVQKKVKTGAKKRLSSAQKAALAKARKKAHSAQANKKRAKSMAKGAKAGLHEDDDFECKECGYVGSVDDFALDENDNLVCPECGAVVEVNESNGTDNQTETPKAAEVDDSEVMKGLLESVKAPQFVFDALNEGKHDFVTGYLNLKMGK